jgi:ubiquinone/menaquinone biosynthesis C-methylase UbiE
MVEYVLQVGKKGFDRLRFLNEIFGKHSRNFVTRTGIGTGATVLELGCGTGSMTTWLAETVGTTGRVIAVDISEKQIEIARSAVEEARFGNVEFVCSPVETLEIAEESVDLVYSRFLLMHLKDPLCVLKKLRKYLKQGGIIASEEPHTSSLETSPRNKNLQSLNDLFVKLGALQGLDFNIGERLLPLLRSAGYSDLNACFVQPVISLSKASEFVLMGAIEIAPIAVKCGLVSEREAERVIGELDEHNIDMDSYYTFPRQAQVFGFK